MPLLPNIGALLAATQDTYADMLDLVDACIDAQVSGEPDRGKVMAFRRRLADAPRYALGSAVTLQTGFLAVAAVALAEQTGQAPADIVADWRRQAAMAVDVAEAQLAGEPGGGQP